MNLDRIELLDLRLDAIVGILPSEQRRVQPLRGRLSMWVDLDAAGSHGDLARSVDYASVAQQVTFLAFQGRFRLIESLAVGALRLLLLPPTRGEARAAVHSAEIELHKPQILAPIAVPGVVLRREAPWAPVPQKRLGDGVVEEVLVDTGREFASRVVLGPATTWRLAEDVAVHLIAGQAIPNHGVLLGPGTSLTAGAAERLVTGKEGATLLVVRVPSPDV